MGSGQLLGQVALPSSTYSLLLTTDPGHIRAAQRLRYRVFTEEFGYAAPARGPDLDADRFDYFCDHLVVRENGSGEIVGTCRLLPPDAAQAAGGLSAETGFDCAALAGIRSGLVETGRSCVAPEHRSGGVIGMIWSGLLRYMVLTGHGWLVGCISVSLADGGMLAAGVRQYVSRRHLAPAPYRVRPLRPLMVAPPPGATTTLPPPLLRGHLRLGAWICGPPGHDPDVDCADFLVLLGLHWMQQGHARHFLGGGQ